MRVRLDRTLVRLSERDVIGVGGEARVFRLSHSGRQRAVKIYHPVDPALRGQARRNAERTIELRRRKLAAFPRGLPDEVLAPTSLARDPASNAVVGFAMPLVEGAYAAHRLGVRKWREGVVSNAAVTALFARLHRVIETLHARGVVVGDLNDGNIICADESVFLIDADSMQFASYPCAAGHERFLDPRLYGIDLSQRPVFNQGSDWYAFGVMLFSSLLYTHPFGGVHPAYHTLLRRAEAGCSVLSAGVIYPKAGVHFSVLPHNLIDWFEAVFERGVRDPFPGRLLDIDWRRCRCGCTHAQSRCPICAPTPLAAVTGSARTRSQRHERCRADRVFETMGRIMAARTLGGLVVIHERDGQLFRDHRPLVATPAGPGVRAVPSTLDTWMGVGNQLVRIGARGETTRYRTEQFAGEPAFDANALAAYCVDGDWLVEQPSGLRIGSVLPGQTWVRVGERLGFGFYRAGLVTVFFLFEPGRAGLRTVDMPPLKGSLVDAAAVFDAHGCLFHTLTEYDGDLISALTAISASGQVIGRLIGPPDSHPALEHVGGKALSSDRILCPTDRGLLLMEIDPTGRRLRDRSLFCDTEPFVRADATVLKSAGGAAYLVSNRNVTQLTLIERSN